jgi:hypothetical protein
MSLETLTKDQLLSILEDKKIVLAATEKQKVSQQKFRFSGYVEDGEVRALVNARCRSCVGRAYEVISEVSEVGKVLTHDGQPISTLRGSKEIACRTCIHIRKQLAEQGIGEVYV